MLRTNRLLLQRVEELGETLRREREERKRELKVWCDNFKGVVEEAQKAVQVASGRRGDDAVRKEVEEALKKAGDYLLFDTEEGRKDGD